jgi:hypothetical protein
MLPIGQDLILSIKGIGIILYAPFFAKCIPEGEDYLSTSYTTDEQVQSHIQKGTIVGFGTGTPGTFILKTHYGYPDVDFLKNCEFRLRLGLQVVGRLICVRDLFDLLQWRAECPPLQSIVMDDGIYHVTLCSNLPVSGILGDNQVINMFFQKLDTFPNLAKQGIPTLCD